MRLLLPASSDAAGHAAVRPFARATEPALHSILAATEIARLGPIAIIPLAEAIVMDRATLGHNLRPLEARGYVKIVVGQDRRSREVSVTKAGRDMLAKGTQLWRRAQLAFEEAIGQDESAKLRAALLRVAAADFGDE